RLPGGLAMLAPLPGRKNGKSVVEAAGHRLASACDGGGDGADAAGAIATTITSASQPVPSPFNHRFSIFPPW
ncbi:MAG TPA: hypothetical protein VHL54_06320, partial [Actinomycetota bacterium]|nr:hypothetical protein [Actinomycetota bacterium]